MITPITQFNPIDQIQTTGTERRKAYDISDTPFGAIFQSAIDNVVETNAAKVQAEYLLGTGQLDNPAELMTAQAKEQMAVELLIQLRNRALDAYQELTRISI